MLDLIWQIIFSYCFWLKETLKKETTHLEKSMNNSTALVTKERNSVLQKTTSVCNHEVKVKVLRNLETFSPCELCMELKAQTNTNFLSKQEDRNI